MRIWPSLAWVLKGSAISVRLASARLTLISPPRVLLPRLEAHLGPRIRIDLAEQGELDLAREEVVLEAGEGAALGLLHVVLGEVADEVAGDAHVEEELARAPALVEREGLARPGEVQERGHAAEGGPRAPGCAVRWQPGPVRPQRPAEGGADSIFCSRSLRLLMAFS